MIEAHGRTFASQAELRRFETSLPSSLSARITEVLSRVKYPGWTWLVQDGHGGTYFKGLFYNSDPRTGLIERQETRKWLVSPHMTDSEVVHTALKCVLTGVEHEVREHFTYRGRRVFSPHFNVEALVSICDEGQDTAGARP